MVCLVRQRQRAEVWEQRRSSPAATQQGFGVTTRTNKNGQPDTSRNPKGLSQQKSLAQTLRASAMGSSNGKLIPAQVHLDAWPVGLTYLPEQLTKRFCPIGKAQFLLSRNSCSSEARIGAQCLWPDQGVHEFWTVNQTRNCDILLNFISFSYFLPSISLLIKSDANITDLLSNYFTTCIPISKSKAQLEEPLHILFKVTSSSTGHFASLLALHVSIEGIFEVSWTKSLCQTAFFSMFLVLILIFNFHLCCIRCNHSFTNIFNNVIPISFCVSLLWWKRNQCFYI